MSSARKLKKEIFSLLQQEDFHKVLQRLEQYRPPDLIHPLFSSICHHNQKVRWNGIFAFGPTVEKLTRSNMEDARVVMRRFLWSLNDESGGIGWGAPEAMAECRVCSQGLRKEYLHMLVSYCQEDGDELFQDGNFIELPALQGGLLWGLLRVASAYPHCMKKYHLEREMSFYLSSNDVQVRACPAPSQPVGVP